jgi:hypothetical protein
VETVIPAPIVCGGLLPVHTDTITLALVATNSSWDLNCARYLRLTFINITTIVYICTLKIKDDKSIHVMYTHNDSI